MRATHPHYSSPGWVTGDSYQPESAQLSGNAVAHLVLTPNPFATGPVLSSDNTAVAGLTLTATPRNGSGTVHATVGSAGHFRVSSATVTSADLTFSHPSGQVATRTLTNVALSATGTQVPPVTMQSQSSISVTLQGPTGTPLSTGRVDLINQLGEVKATATPSAQGVAVLTGMPADRYVLRASSGGFHTEFWGNTSTANTASVIEFTGGNLVLSEPMRLGRSEMYLYPPTGIPLLGHTVTYEVDRSGLPDDLTFIFQWLRSTDSHYPSAWVAIPGATADSHVLGVDDHGAHIGLRVTASAEGITDVVSTLPFSVNPIGKREFDPTSLSASSVALGSEVSVVTDLEVEGSDDIQMQVQWLRNGVAIPGATGRTYRPTAADIGQALTVTVTRTHPFFEPSTETHSVERVVAGTFPTSAVTLAGSARVGSPLSLNLGSISPEHVSVVWRKRNTTETLGTGTSFTPTPELVGAVLEAVVSFAGEGYSSTSKTLTSSPIALGVLPTPAIEGTLRPGETVRLVWPEGTPDLGSTNWTWSGFLGNNHIDAPNNTGASFVIPEHFQAAKVRVRIRPALTGYAATELVVTTDGSVAWATFSGEVELTGTTRVGETLEATYDGALPDGTTATWSWYRGNDLIEGADTDSLTLSSADEGKTITARLSLRRTGYVAATPSATSAIVAPGVFSGGTLTLPDTARFGSTLTPTVTLPTPAPTGDLTWEWRTNDEVLATTQSWTPALTDIETEVTVRVTGTRPGYTVWTVERTVTIEPALGASVKPRIAGSPVVGRRLSATGVPAGAAGTWQWLRNGNPIKGATAAAYTTTAADAGSRLTVRLIARRPGHTDAVGVSNVFGPIKNATALKLAASKIKKTKNGKKNGQVTLTATLVVSGTATSPIPSTLRFTLGKKKVQAKVKIVKGKAVVKVTKLRKGKHTFTVRYAGSGRDLASTRTMTVRIR